MLQQSSSAGAHGPAGEPGPSRTVRPDHAAWQGVGTSQSNGAARSQSSKPLVLDLTLGISDESDMSDIEVTVTPRSKPALRATLVRRSPAQVPRDGPASLSPLPRLRHAVEEFDTPLPTLKRNHSSEVEDAQKRARGTPSTSATPRDKRHSPVHLPSPPVSKGVAGSSGTASAGPRKTFLEPSPSARSDALEVAAAVHGSTPALPNGKTRAEGVPRPPATAATSVPTRPLPGRPPNRPPASRLSLGRHPCRVPPQPPPLPKSVAAATLPFLLSLSPRAVLARPHPRFDPSAAPRSRDRSSSPRLDESSTHAAGSSASGATTGTPRRRTQRRRVGLVESGGDHWRHVVPDLTDWPHDGDDVAFLNKAAHSHLHLGGLEPAEVPLSDVEPLLQDRTFADPEVLGANEAEALTRAARLPDPWGVETMKRKQREAQHEEDARRASRRQRTGQRRAMPKGGHRGQLWREPEAVFMQRVRRLDAMHDRDLDVGTDSEATSSSDDDGDDDDERSATVGFRAMALATHAGHRALRRARVAEGRDPDESTDEEEAGR